MWIFNEEFHVFIQNNLDCYPYFQYLQDGVFCSCKAKAYGWFQVPRNRGDWRGTQPWHQQGMRQYIVNEIHCCECRGWISQDVKDVVWYSLLRLQTMKCIVSQIYLSYYELNTPSMKTAALKWKHFIKKRILFWTFNEYFCFLFIEKE